MSNNGNSKQTPAIRPMQFEGNASDLFKDSVNLFRGDVNLSLDLVSLTGRNGLDVKVTASYGSNVKNVIKESNVTAATGIMGLGWALPFERIDIDDRDNASLNDNKYYLHTQNSSIELVPGTTEWQRASLDTAAATVLDQKRIDTAVREAFGEAGLSLDPASSVEVIQQGSIWGITDSHNQRLYRVEKRGTQLAALAGGDFV